MFYPVLIIHKNIILVHGDEIHLIFRSQITECLFHLCKVCRMHGVRPVIENKNQRNDCRCRSGHYVYDTSRMVGAVLMMMMAIQLCISRAAHQNRSHGR